MFAVVFGHFLDLIFGNVCHVLHLKMFALALAFQDVSVEDVCICISFSFQFVHLFAFYLIYADSRLGTDSRLFF